MRPYSDRDGEALSASRLHRRSTVASHVLDFLQLATRSRSTVNCSSWAWNRSAFGEPRTLPAHRLMVSLRRTNDGPRCSPHSKSVPGGGNHVPLTLKPMVMPTTRGEIETLLWFLGDGLCKAPLSGRFLHLPLRPRGARRRDRQLRLPVASLDGELGGQASRAQGVLGGGDRTQPDSRRAPISGVQSGSRFHLIPLNPA